MMNIFQTATVTIQRSVNNTWITVATNIPVQLDTISPVVASQIAGASPYNSYEVYTIGCVPDIRQADRLVDQAAIDPKTQASVTYTVMGNPEPYFDHLQVLCEKIVGKIPA